MTVEQLSCRRCFDKEPVGYLCTDAYKGRLRYTVVTESDGSRRLREPSQSPDKYVKDCVIYQQEKGCQASPPGGWTNNEQKVEELV